MRRRSIAAVLALTLAAAAGGSLVVRAQEARDRAADLAACRSLMADRDWTAAEAKLIDFARTWRNGDAVEESVLLLARARILAGRPQEALDTLSTLVKEAPKSPWAEKARWVMADAYVALRNWDGASETLRVRAEFLASDDHQRDVANLYLEVADRAYDGREVVDDFGRRTLIHDWPRAADFYRRARAVRVEEKDRARVAHRIAQASLEAGDPAAAVQEWTALLAAGDPGALRKDVVFGLGRALLIAGDARAARLRLREVVTTWPDDDLAPRALILLGDSWRPLSPAGRADLDRGLDAWREFRRLYDGHEEGPRIAHRIGLALAGFGDRPAAITEWETFLRRYPKHDLAPEVVHGIALARLGLEEFDGATAALKDLLARWPNHRLWQEARALLPRIAQARAEALARDEKRAEATVAYRAFLEEFPDDSESPMVQMRLGDVLRDAGDAARALAEWRLVAEKWPADSRAATALDRVAHHLAAVAGDLPAAIAAYERLVAAYPQSPEGRAAAVTLAAMKGRHLEATQARPVTTDRRPRIAMKLRNIDRMRMKAYRVDLEEFVRARNSLDGADAVVTDVVKADAEWTWRPENHEPFRLLERECEIPVDGPGAWIVRAQDEELSATLLVISSDLAVVAKRGDHQTLVFVQNARTGEPVAGARILMPGDGSAVTGADGVWIGGNSAGRVLVEHGGSLAFAAGEGGSSTSFGYSTKVYLFTDRPLYRPGDTVIVKGFARRVRSGAYECRAGDVVVLQVLDARGNVVATREVRTDRFGGIEAKVPVADGAPLGPWRVTARYDDRTFEGGFDVREYRKPELEVSVVTPVTTYMAGAEIKAKVTVRYAVGGVARGVPVRWRTARTGFVFDGSGLASYASWFRDPVREAERRRRTAAEEGEMAELSSGEAVTDEEGRLEITIPTEGDDTDRRYILELMARDSGGTWTREASSWPVTRQGWYAVVRAERKVYRPKEEMTMELFTVDALQDPMSAKGRAVLARLRTLPGRMVEEEISSVAIETGPDGRAVAKLKADRPGEYALRFVGADVRGNPVIASAAVTVSGPAEDLSRDLKVVCDRETYREGDAAQVLVNVPFAPATVLLTVEGEKVLEHRVLRLAERSTTVELAMGGKFSPNVFVRGALLQDGELKESGDEVLVFRFLKIEVVPGVTEAEPGTVIPVTVRTTDQRGNPVAAGVAISAVDRALLSLQPDRTPDPRPFFYDQRRTHGVRTVGGLAFLPQGKTFPTNKDLLFEEARRLGREAWEKFRNALEEGRAAAQRGDLETAKEALGRALEIAPGQYDARVLLVQVNERARELEDRKVRQELASLGEKMVDDRLRDELKKAEGVDLDSATRAADGLRDKDARPASARAASKNANFRGPAGEVPPDARAPMESMEDASESESGIGGGSGGAFGGRRGGSLSLRARGGGGKANAPAFGFAAGGGGVGGGGFLDAVEVPAALRTNFAEVALWNGALFTGDDGEAKVDLVLPDNLTTWSVRARGASEDTLVGEGSASVKARKRLLVRISAPRFLGGKDRAEIVTVVHNDTGEEVDLRATLGADGVPVAGTGEQRASMKSGEVRPFPWTVDGGAPGLAVLHGKALSTVASDAADLPFPITPHGIPWRRSASGTCSDMAVAALDLAAGAIPGTVKLRVSVSPDLDSVLLNAVRWNGAFPYGCLEQTVNRFLPALAAEDALRRVGLPDAALRDGLREAVERGLGALYGFQRDDGGFGWFQGGASDPVMTAYAVMAMLRAESQGHPVASGARQNAINAARTMARGGSADDRAFLLYALSFGGAAELDDLGSVHRGRESLSDRGLACLALAFHQSGRADRAGECVALLRSRAVRDGDRVHWEDGTAACRRRGLPVHEGTFHWLRDAEPTAMALRALVAVSPADPLEDGAVRWLLLHRRGPCWRSTRDTGAAVDALAAVLVRRGVERNNFNLQVFLDDGAEPVATVEVVDAGGTASPLRDLVIPVAALAPGRHTVRLQKEGPGSFHWAATLEAWLEGEDIPAEGNLLRVDSRFVRYIPVRDGSAPADEGPPVGWSCCDPAVRPGDDALPSVATAGSGDLFRCVVTVDAKQDLDYALIEVPLPAGCEVVEGREQGGFDRFERRDDRAVFFVSRLAQGRRSLSFVLQAVFPGDYHVMPAVASGMYEPEVTGRSAERRLHVVPDAGAVNRRGDGESPTPDEILFLARRALADERWESARDGFRGLLGGPRLLPEIEAEAWESIRRACFRLKDHRGAVEAHEALSDRDPRRAATGRDDRLSLAVAYRSIGEHERATALFREVADLFHQQESEVADAYASLGETERSLALRGDALRRHADGALTDAGELALARTLAATRRTGAAGSYLPEAAERLRSFLSHRPALRNADEADVLLVEFLRRMELHDEALAEGTRFLRRYPESRWLDDTTWYLAASAFDKGDHDGALRLSEPLLDGQFVRDDDTSRRAKSPLRFQAMHLRGKVAHLRGNLDEAVRWYWEARSIPDAADAHAFLTQQRLEVPELESFPAGEEPVLKLRGRNVAGVEARVYPVDFMILYALRKNLGEVNRIDLTGIMPAARVKGTFEGSGDRRWHDLGLRLPVKEKGVYLVQIGGASGGASLVLVSDLRMEVQRAGPRVRAYVTDARTGAPVDEVFVKIADGGTILAQGFTDARGIFEAPGVRGAFSVVAEKDGSYALYR